MPRSKRILVEKGIYHIFNRGISRKDIQFCKDHSDYFIKILKEAVKRYNVKIFAYCLMKNHYHLMTQTSEANLDKFMQFFGSRLSRGINKMIGGDGALFKERYRSLLVEDESYLYQLFKYIHLNPVQANIVSHADQYLLSSYRSYTENEKDSDWLDKNFMLNRFRSLDALRGYHEGNIPSDLEKLYKRKRLPSKISKATISGNY